MKKRSLILIVFLMLYITPAIFSISPMHTGIVAEPFTLSDYGDISNQSVFSISNTLQPDVLFYPDISTSEIYLATSGDSGFENTTVKDGVYFILLGGGNADINFVFNDTTAQIEGFEYAIYGYEVTDDATCKYYQYPGWTSLIAFTVTPSFYNGTVDLPEILHGVANNYTVTIKLDASVTADLYVDYVQIQFKYMTLKDSDHYGESFADVSDWDVLGAGITPVSDGDVMTFGVLGDTNWYYIETDGPSITSGNYIELNYKSNTTAADYLRVYLAEGDGYTGATVRIATLTVEEYWKPFKLILEQDVECLRLGARSLDVVSGIMFDYIRMGPANETGFQHDGSSTGGVNSSTGDTVTSDGDQLHLESGVGDDNSFDIVVDTTTTPSAIDCSYYPFLEIKTTGISEGDGWKLELFNGSDWTEITDGPYYGWMAYEYGIGIFRYNIETLADEVYTFRINTTATADVYIDYIWMFSIANFTLSSGSSNTVDDVLYCENGELISLTTEGTNRYWILDYDIPLSIPFTYNNYSLDVSVNTQWFAEYIGGWQSWKVDEPSGFLTKGTVTDFKILIDGTTKLSSILFIETLSWQSLDGVTFYFVIGSLYGSWTIQSLVIFLGLVMIPVSTIYLVHGGRDNISMDKVFYFFIMFIIGWALVIGGIVS